MCRNNGPGSLTKINKSTTKGALIPILLLLCDLSSLVGPVSVLLPSGAGEEDSATGKISGRVSRC